MKQRSLTEFFGAHAGAGVGAGAGAGAGGHQGADNAAATLTALYTPKVTGRNHYAIRKKDYNPTGAEAQAFFNITELAGTFLTKGRRVLLDKFTRMAAHTIVAGTRQQKQRQAMARKYRGVAIFTEPSCRHCSNWWRSAAQTRSWPATSASWGSCRTFATRNLAGQSRTVTWDTWCIH